MPTSKSELLGTRRPGEALPLRPGARTRRHRWARRGGALTAIALISASMWAGTAAPEDVPALQAMSLPMLNAPHQAEVAAAQQQAVQDQAAAQAEADELARLRFPADALPAASLPGLTIPETPTAAAAASPNVSASGRAAAAVSAGAGVRVGPAMRARLEAEARASRAADRAMLGARPGFARPVEGAHMTSPFGQRWGRLHAGVDYAGPVGLSIRAVAGGTVTVAEVQPGYGNLVEVEHEDGSFSRYGHLQKIRVEVGDEVEPAQIIAALGNTGRSTGPHLHFEVRTPKGAPIDPMPWLTDRGVVPVDATK